MFFNYLSLGHIHSYKMDSLDRRGVYCYPGCLEGRGFDECGEQGFVLPDIECERNIEYIQKQFEDDFYFIKVVDQSTYKVDMEAFAHDISLKGEFVRTVLESGEIAMEDNGWGKSILATFIRVMF